MKALFLNAPGSLELRDVPVPEPGPGEILVRVVAATTCGTDLKAFRRGHPKIPMPGPFGHEWSGTVARSGAGAAFREGDDVMGVHTAPCGHCDWCRGDQGNLCATIMETMVLGSYAEYLLIPARIASRHVCPKPATLPFEIASLLEPLSSVTQGALALPRFFREPGEALVIGPGAIGLMWGAVLRRMGWTATVAGRNPDRLAAARAMGLNAVPLAELGSRPVDLVVECTGQVEIWERAPDYLRRGGWAILFGGPPGGTRASFDTHRLHYDEIGLYSPFHFGTPAVEFARECLLDPAIDFRPIVSGDRSLDDGAAVFADLEAGRGIKWAIRPSGVA